VRPSLVEPKEAREGAKNEVEFIGDGGLILFLSPAPGTKDDTCSLPVSSYE
jgi:hypothetical protein